MEPRHLSFQTALASLLLAASLAGGAFYFFGQRTLSYTVTLPAAPGENGVALAYGAEPALANPDFFGQVKTQFITDRADFIEADLSNMTVRLYQAGELKLEVPIKTKGREGSWWETPAGLYKVNSKETSHFSSFGHVYQPWSLNFQGNFYIHGWPYYPGGEAVSSQYSGGCIRLETADAKKLYDLATVGMPLLVFERDFSTDNFNYEANSAPALGAESYLAADLLNNHVFADKNTTLALPIASLTKLVTALVATEYLNLDNLATVPAEALVYTSKPRLKAGQTLSVYELLFPLLRESSNEAAETIARAYGRERFIGQMNAKATAIGMTHTRFVDPSGAGAENLSTAEDLFMLAKYIYNNRSFVFKLTAGQLEASAYGANPFPDLGNFNDFVGHPAFFGSKNGQTTAAEETELAVFEFPVGATRRPIVFITLHSNQAKAETETLINQILPRLR